MTRKIWGDQDIGSLTFGVLPRAFPRPIPGFSRPASTLSADVQQPRMGEAAATEETMMKFPGAALRRRT